MHFLVEQKDYDEALAELDRADAGKPPTSDSLRLRADIQIAQKNVTTPSSPSNAPSP